MSRIAHPCGRSRHKNIPMGASGFYITRDGRKAGYSGDPLPFGLLRSERKSVPTFSSQAELRW